MEEANKMSNGVDVGILFLSYCLNFKIYTWILRNFLAV